MDAYEIVVNIGMTIFTLFFVVAAVFVCWLAYTHHEREVEYWSQVHKNNQDKIKRDETAAFLSTLDMPVPYKSTRSKGEKDGESKTA